jgi:hypothetical protein
MVIFGERFPDGHEPAVALLDTAKPLGLALRTGTLGYELNLHHLLADLTNDTLMLQ